MSRRRGAGALAGVIALLTAAILYDLTKLGDFSGPILVRQFWLAGGVLFGMAFGALGGWWGERPGRNWIAPGLAAGAVAGEALALAAGGLLHPRSRAASRPRRHSRLSRQPSSRLAVGLVEGRTSRQRIGARQSPASISSLGFLPA